MKTAYKVVFYFSILMAILLFLDAVSAGGKPSPQMLGVLLSCYTAWLMKKQEIKQLVSLYKGVFWFQLILLILVLAFLIPSDETVNMLVGRSSLEVLINGGFGLCIFGAYYLFFKKYQNSLNVVPVNSIPNKIEIEDQYWEKAYLELEDEKNDAAWAKALVQADGNEIKARGIYLNVRAHYHMQNAEIESRSNILNDKQNIKVKYYVWALIIALIVMILLVTKIYNLSNDIAQMNQFFGQEKNQSASSKDSQWVGKLSELNPSTVDVCYVYWNGLKWLPGKTDGKEFVRISYSRFGVNVAEFSLPAKMAEEFQLVDKSNPFNEFSPPQTLPKYFFDTTWNQIKALCNFDFEND